RSSWRLHRGNSAASRKPHRCSVDRHWDRACGVRAVLLEVARPAYHAHRRRVGGDSENRGAIPTRSLYFKISVRLGTSCAGKIETSIRKRGLITYENVNRNNSVITSAIWRCFFARSESDENFQCNRSSR